jgi:hypothetical protein
MKALYLQGLFVSEVLTEKRKCLGVGTTEYVKYTEGLGAWLRQNDCIFDR